MRQQLVIGIGVVITVVVLVSVFRIPLPSMVAGVVQPVAVQLHSLGVGVRTTVTDLVANNQDMRIAELENELREQRLRTVVAEQNQRELAELRAHFELEDELDIPDKTARIVNYHAHPSRAMVRIAVGSEDGIAPGMPVLAEGVVIGVTENVSRRSSEVALVHDSEFRALATLSRNDTAGLIRGQIGQGARLEQIPSGSEIEVGDNIVTSGLDGTYPPGLLIGSVASMVEDADSVFMQAVIRHPVDFRFRSTVTVLLYE